MINIAKNVFKSELDKGKVLSITDFLDESYLAGVPHEYTELLRNWYLQITSINFLLDLPSGSQEILFHNAEFSEIIIRGKKQAFGHDLTSEDIDIIYNYITIKHNIPWNYNNPFQSFYIKVHSQEIRVSLTHKSITATNQSKGFFRILNNSPNAIETYKYYKFLEKIIHEKKNILVAGATGSGKTTLVNSMINLIPSTEHILILEDTKELISPNDKTTRLLSNEQFNQPLDKLLAYGLRMSPERIILGELRSHEVTAFTLAMNTGHEGMISTIHANSAQDALSRVAMMFMMYSGTNLTYDMILKLICQNIDHVVYLENKQVKEIIEVYGAENTSIFFEKSA